ncbi:hypothetical protein [Modestobacter sp. SYSU DS0657]
MTVLTAAPVPRLRRARTRWAWGLGALAVVCGALAGAGLLGGEVVNRSGTAQFGRFAAAALAPELDPAFLSVLGTATLVTIAYAALGTALAVGLGAVGAVAVARTTWGRRRAGWLMARGALAVPRGLHEAVWGLLLALRHCTRVVGLVDGRVVLDARAERLGVGDLADIYGAPR